MNIPAVDVVVFGSGPAGTTTALGLKKLGYAVTVISSPRTFAACEGISERVVEGLRNAGCQNAGSSLPAPTPRFVRWDGVSSSANQERLVLREEFDGALLEDLRQAGIEVVLARVGRIEWPEETLANITIVDQDDRESLVTAGFIVDARGRSAPGGGETRIRGPETVSLLQHWRGPACPPQSMAATFADGWAWLARTADGQRFTQITLAADAPGFPKKSGLRDYYLHHLNSVPEAARFYQDAIPQGELTARSSTSVLHKKVVRGRFIRVGDAAMAPDPLSGNGIFNALSTALVAPAVINTIMQSSSRALLAARFYEERVRHSFMRFARIGRDFYAMEKSWPSNQFWLARAQWPDAEPAHSTLEPQLVGIQKMPVVDNYQIREREVVITSDQPQGVWHIGGIELAPVIRAARKLPLQTTSELYEYLPSLVSADKRQLPVLVAWLMKYGLVRAPEP
jgi:flavin-dependent dehydrogenase